MSVRYGLHPGFLLTNFDRLLISTVIRLLELNGVNFWRLCFYEVLEANIRFFDFLRRKTKLHLLGAETPYLSRNFRAISAREIALKFSKFEIGNLPITLE